MKKLLISIRHAHFFQLMVELFKISSIFKILKLRKLSVDVNGNLAARSDDIEASVV
jgi:hypothetical protein